MHCLPLVLVDLLLDLLLAMALGLLTVDKVQSLGLSLAVDKGTDEAGQDLLGLGVASGIACNVCQLSFTGFSAN